MNLAMVVAALAVFTFGMVTVIPGSIKLRLVERVHMDDAQMGRVLVVWQGTTLVLALIAGPLLDRVGHKPILIAGFLLVGVAIWFLSIASRLSGVMLAAVILGIGGSCVNTGGNTLLPALDPSNPAAASNLGNVFFGLGAFTVPFACSYLFDRVRYSTAVAVFGVISACAAIPAFLATYPVVSSGFQLSTALSLLGNGSALLAGLILFCYIGLEVSTASWTTTYLRKVGFNEHQASVLFSLFWVSMIAGRLIASQAVTTAIGRSTVQVVALAAAIGLFVMTVTVNRTLAGACVVLTGFFFGPVFPTTIGVTFTKFSPSLYGSVFAIMFSIGLVGSSIIPGLIGHYSKTRSIQVGYRLMVLLAVLLFLLAWRL